MNGNTNMRTNQQVTEITGAPAQVWGNVLVPAKGTILVKFTGDTLVGTTKTGLEKRETWIRIQNIDSVETLEAPIYALLGFGGFLAFSALGAFRNSSALGLILLVAAAALIVYAITNKRRYLAIYSHRNAIVVFMNKSPELYQQFAMNVLALSRKLNAPSNTQTRQPQTQIQA
ncbi:MAG: hypothetical protein HWQ35_17595 [Nostoc sp. NMS1]|uniref:hypothetical protein n=1 Tax=unclassified Nostoc TaxID=2593658 RepID=UPI0025E1C5A0|nr:MULTISPECIES: hypothetical protein [unclassified Nostoc]MBN3908282.1 hypothetical protein [Nostoc sp. NMS1]MBN3992421.1 hypothetical protein [Nostoc sp. NMS2]